MASRYRPLWSAALLLGIGLGGFVDGIVFHQILQWHHMATGLPSVADDLRFNMLLDGLFHVVMWIFTFAGVWLLHRAWRRDAGSWSANVLAGAMLAGWGLFNLVEGIVNHHLLGIHHVWPMGPGPVWAWDVAFLASGVTLLVIGVTLARRGGNNSPE